MTGTVAHCTYTSACTANFDDTSHHPRNLAAVRLRVIGARLAFDLNGPTACDILTAPAVQSLLDRLGVDPLRADADPEKAWDRIRKSATPIGSILMNQNIIAGVGNVYCAEILHLLQIHPERKASSLQRQEFDALWQLTVRLLQIGKRYNRIIIADPADVGKPRGRMTRDERLLVYKKISAHAATAPSNRGCWPHAKCSPAPAVSKNKHS
jgi:endonuclease-8